MRTRACLFFLLLTAVPARAGDPNVTFDPDAPAPKKPPAFEQAEDTSRRQVSEPAEVPRPVAQVEAETKPRSKAFTVYKAPPRPAPENVEPPAEADAPEVEVTRDVAATSPAADAPSGASADSIVMGTMDGPVVSTVLNGEHSPQAVRDSLPFLPKIKINGGGSGSTGFKFGH